MALRCQDLLQFLSMKAIVSGKARGKIPVLRTAAFPVSVMSAFFVRSLFPKLGTLSKALRPSPAIGPAVIESYRRLRRRGRQVAANAEREATVRMTGVAIPTPRTKRRRPAAFEFNPLWPEPI